MDLLVIGLIVGVLIGVVTTLAIVTDPDTFAVEEDDEGTSTRTRE
jgi:hypothetical protein